MLKARIFHGVLIAFSLALVASGQEFEIVRTPYVTLEAPRNYTKSERKGGGLDFITGPPNVTLGFMIEVIALTDFKERTWKTLPEYFASIHKSYTPYRIRGREWGVWIDEHRFPVGNGGLTQKTFLYLGNSRMFFVNYRYEPAYSQFDIQFKRMLDSIQLTE
jgi:hypothetical protein